MDARGKRLWLGVLIAAVLALTAVGVVAVVTWSGSGHDHGPGMTNGDRDDHGPGMMNGHDGDDEPGSTQGNRGSSDDHGPGMMSGSAYRIPAHLDAVQSAPRI